MTECYAIFGNPVAQSKSPLIHAEFARQFGIDMTYAPILAPADGFAAALRAFIAAGGRGCNITTPFKLDAHAAATQRRPRAQIAGAANLLKIAGDAIIADNVDGVGLVNDIRRNLGLDPKGLRVLILGAGGAARGSVLPLLEAGPARLTLANRTPARAGIVRDLMQPWGEVVACGLDEIDRGFDIVLNATSSGLRGECPAVPEVAFDGCRLAYDMTYGKGLTPFLALAAARGVPRLADGVGMLVEQAAESFLIWRGVRPDTAGLIARLTVPLERGGDRRG